MGGGHNGGGCVGWEVVIMEMGVWDGRWSMEVGVVVV